MIGFFADPYPDELFFSACSRYHELLNYQNRECTGRDLFGASRTTVAVDLPGKLDHFLARLPTGHRYSANRIIDENTLYPIYSPFLSSERASSLRDAMRRAKGGAIHARAGVLTSRVGTQYLRTCPGCVDEDRDEFGETYWHRHHQVYGVEVCPAHQVFLEDSGVRMWSRGNDHAYVTAEQVVGAVIPRRLNPCNQDHATLIRIALDVAWLLGQHELACDPNVTRNRYLRLLLEQGFAHYSGIVRATKLQDSFVQFYSSHLLLSFSSDMERRVVAWLSRIVQASDSSQPTLHHLLLMNFLGCPAQHFFSLPEGRLAPFGDGPWPCLNQASDHFGELRVVRCEITKVDRRNGNPVGSFYCGCGFTYCRSGSDQASDSRLRFSSIESYGDVWYATVRRLRESEGLSHRKIAARLGVSPSLIAKQLSQLHSLSLGTVERLEAAIKESRHKKAPALLESYRKQWLRVAMKYPEASRSQVRQKIPARYSWLVKHDREWFEANAPPRRQPLGPPQLIKWDKRDEELAGEARAKSAEMMAIPGRPVRASATAIGRAIGALEVVHKRRGLLPLTSAAIWQVAETVEDYAIRRIQWAAEFFRQRAVKPNLSELQIRSAVGRRIWKRPKVRRAVAATMKSFRQ